MRTKFFTLAVLFLSVFHLSNAQISKGSILLGGSFGLSTTKDQTGNVESKQNNFYFSPAAGVAVKQNLIAGGDLLFNYSEYPAQNGKQFYRTYGAGFFMRKYVPVANRFYVFGQVRAGVSSFNNTLADLVDYRSKQTGWGLNVSFNPGISYAINNKWQLEAGFNDMAYLNYQHQKTQTNSFGGTVITKRNSFSAGSNLNNFSSSLFIGFRFLLNKSKS